jgi:hypothetical protein
MAILFSRDSCDFVFMSQFIFLILSSNCLLLAFICVCHVSFLSRWSPKYLTFCMGKLLILTCGQIVRLVVNVLCVDFAGLTVIFHCSVQFGSKLRCCCNFWEAVLWSLSDDIIASWTQKMVTPRRPQSVLSLQEKQHCSHCPVRAMKL